MIMQEKEPVSYTHLDVYKRQVHSCADCHSDDFYKHSDCKPQTGKASGFHEGGNRLTGKDVYKRQGFGLLSWKRSPY